MTASGRKYVIGLTGNIATGKTLVLRMLKELGAYTIDADDLAHVLMRRGGPLYDRVVAEFGRYILGQDSEIDRGRLGEIVFASPRDLARLETVTHPTITVVAWQLIAKAKAGVAVVEAIKLIESGLANDCDAIWVVTAAPDVQVRRLMTKRRLSGLQARQRVEAQPPQEGKVARADVVIENSGDILETWTAVQRHYAAIPRLAVPSPESAHVVSAREHPIEIEALPTHLLRKLEVRRARRADLAAMAAAVAQAPDDLQMVEMFFSKGYFLAWAGERLLGMVGLHTENRMATIDDYLVRSSALWPTVGKALLDAVETDARQQSCDVVLMFVRPDVGPLAMILFDKNGYQRQEPTDLPIKMWREVAEGYTGDGSVLLVKRLLDQQAMRPI